MAFVDLTHVWLHKASDLSLYVRLRARDVQASTRRDVSTRKYAGGRVRSISSPAVEKTYSWEALLVDRATLDQLEEWAGELLFYRDPWGRAGYGFISEVPAQDYIAPAGRTSVDLTFEVVTGDVSV